MTKASIICTTILLCATQRAFAGGKPQNINENNCHRWVKTVTRQGLDMTAQNMEPIGYYCLKPDSVVVDKTVSNLSYTGSDNGGVYHRRRHYRPK